MGAQVKQQPDTEASTAATRDTTGTPLSTGTVVVDTDDTEPTRAIVVNTPPKPASEWYIPSGGNVAADNPAYPADEHVAVVVFEPDLETARPYYAGQTGLSLSELHREGVRYYAFPSRRLKIVDSWWGPHELPIERLRPAPWHSRSFSSEANSDYIAEIRAAGELPRPVLCYRDGSGEFRLLNGHKRVWAAAAAGFETVAGRCAYLDQETAARTWANRHLDDYSSEQYAAACRRLRETLGVAGKRIVADHEERSAGGGR